MKLEKVDMMKKLPQKGQKSMCLLESKTEVEGKIIESFLNQKQKTIKSQMKRSKTISKKGPLMEEQEKIYENQRHTHAIAEIIYKDSCY